MLRICLLLLITAFGTILACTSQSGNSTKLADETYWTILPCADCEGIAYRIEFRANNEFEATSMYVGESSKKFRETGRWSVNQDSVITLKQDEKVIRRLLIEDRGLLLLYNDENKPEGPLAGMRLLQKIDADMQRDQWDEELEQGIDFRATGNEPFWLMNIDFEEMIMFKTMNGDSVTAEVPEIELEEESGAREFATNTGAGSLSIAYFPVGCIDSMSGSPHDYRVHVEFNGKGYIGCGDLINADYQIAGYWRPVSISGRPLSELTEQSEDPWLSISFSKNRIAGFTGCNEFSGQLSVEDDIIELSNVNLTENDCEEEVESIFMNSLQSIDAFSYENQELTLHSSGSAIMTLERY